PVRRFPAVERRPADDSEKRPRSRAHRLGGRRDRRGAEGPLRAPAPCAAVQPVREGIPRHLRKSALMAAKLKHIALVSDNYAVQGKFYEAAFGMRTAADPRPERAVTVGDGYVGLN